MEVRNSARAVIINHRQEVLLLKFSFPEFTDNLNRTINEFWVTPGGGLESGETFLAALRRELYEEIGLTLPINIVPPQIWTREVMLEWQGKQFLSHEHYFLVQLNKYQLDQHRVDSSLMLSNEKMTLKDYRWWPVAEIEHADEAFRPPALATELNKILAGPIGEMPIVIS